MSLDGSDRVFVWYSVRIPFSNKNFLNYEACLQTNI